jgi:hypothetical protein
MFNRLFLANITNVELAILLEMITVRATVVRNHRGLLLRSAGVIIVVVTFSFP